MATAEAAVDRGERVCEMSSAQNQNTHFDDRDHNEKESVLKLSLGSLAIVVTTVAKSCEGSTWSRI